MLYLLRLVLYYDLQAKVYGDSMAVKNKAIASIIVILTCLFLYFCSRIILVDGFTEIETARTRRNVDRALSALSFKLHALDYTAADWAGWDDTYEFVKDANDKYINTNLEDITFLKLGLNLMLFINTSGDIVYGKAFDLNTKEGTPTPDILKAYLSGDSPLLRHTDLDSSATGIVFLPGGPMLIASRPIMTSQHQGAIRGSLIMGRYLDSEEVGGMSELAHLSISVYNLDDSSIASHLRSELLSSSEEAPVAIHPLGEDFIAGYTLLKDISGNPGLVLKVQIPRDIYSQSKNSIFYIGLLILVLGFMLYFLIFLSLENTERRVAEEKLRESEALFQTMADNAPVLLWMSDTGGLCTFFNKVWLNFTGRTMAQEIGNGWEEGVHPEDREQCFSIYRSALEFKKEFEMEYRLRCTGGEYRWVYDRGVPRFSAVGKFEGYIGSALDITGRRRAEEELREIEQRFRIAFEYAATGMALVGTDGRWLQVNRSLCKMLGYSEQELLSMTFQEITHPEDLNIDSFYMHKMINLDLSTSQFEKRYIHRLGHMVWVHLSASRVIDAQGIILYFIAQMQDITLRKLTEANLEEVRKKAERSERMASLGTMAAGIAHEINQPLNSLKINVDGILFWNEKGKPLDTDVIILKMKELSAQVDRINNIIQRIRSFVKTGNQTLLTLCCLNEVVEAVLHMLVSQLSSHGIQVRKSLSGTCLTVKGDTYRLEQVVTNLLVNAMQALDEMDKEEKEIYISTYMEKNIVLEISDNASGVHEEIRDTIYEPFFTTKEAGEGMGLGLSIVHSIVTSFNGQINVMTNEKGGATFKVEFPFFIS